VSNFEATVEPASAERDSAAVGTLDDGPRLDRLVGRPVVLGGNRARGTAGMTVIRTLPNRIRRMVGAWCFVDHFVAERVGDVGGPADSAGMDVPPHPHIGLQTVTWLLEGEVRHHDTLGNTQLVRPGELNLMTAGRGIAHAEVSPAPLTGPLHGVQLWVALLDSDRGCAPAFEHHARLPTASSGAVRVLVGSLLGVTSPAQIRSPLVAAEIRLEVGGSELTLELEPTFEHAVLPLTDAAVVAGEPVARGELVYLGLGRDRLTLSSHVGSTLLLLGGEPFEERLVMWWNFVARSHDEVVAARQDWLDGRFGPVPGYPGSDLPPPNLPLVRLLPRGRVSGGDR
jgi:redox-sensitive bicupin YhaK (pirin superfamily)